MVSVIVYSLCAVTSLLCALALFRNYARTGVRLLLWSALCFAGMALNNVVLFVDMLVFQDLDLSLVRIFPGVLGVGLLLYGMIWDTA